MSVLRIASYNLHKGRSIFGRRFSFENLKKFLELEEFDIGLFQEVLGNHKENSEITHQVEQLADEKWSEFSFACNSIVSNTEHGNAILSKFPIIDKIVIDLSLHRLEKRCAVLSVIEISKEIKLYCVCTHLNLRQSDRLKQIDKLISFLNENVPKTSPVLVGGDFNDWNGTVSSYFEAKGNFKSSEDGQTHKTFPSLLPLFPLDRFFYRNLEMNNIEVGNPKKFKKFSDHLPLFCNIDLGL